MCIAIFKPADKTIDRDTLAMCNLANPDGMGVAFPSNCGRDVVVLKAVKNTEFDGFYKEYVRCVEDKKLPAAIHFRIATSGNIDEDNCHPFKVHPSLAFIHNGIIQIAQTRKDKSDTWHFNRNILQQMPRKFLEYAAIRELIADYIGGYSKLVFLDSKGQHAIINDAAGVWDEGVWYSNTSYLPKKASDYTMWDDDYYGYHGVDRATTKRKSNNPFKWTKWQRCGSCDVSAMEDEMTAYKEKNGVTYHMCGECAKWWNECGVTDEVGLERICQCGGTLTQDLACGNDCKMKEDLYAATTVQ